MSKLIAQDLIEGASIQRTRDGYTATRTFQVAGLSGDAGVRMASALVADKIPQPGDKHPSVIGMTVSSVSATFQGPTLALVTVQYATEKAKDKQPNNDPAQISVGATLQSTSTTNDFKKNIIQVKFLSPAALTAWQESLGSGDDPPQPEATIQTGEVQVQIPCVVLRYTRREKMSPQKNAMAYVGKINSGTFAGQKEKTWLCTRIDGTSNDNGKTFVVDYEFQFKENTWDSEVVYIDRATNYPPDMPLGTKLSSSGPYFGTTTAQVYETVNFKELKLGDNAGDKIGGGFTGQI